MFPVADFNFYVCGFATVAATVGYACSRRLSFSSRSRSPMSAHFQSEEPNDERCVTTPPASPESEITVPTTPSSYVSEIAGAPLVHEAIEDPSVDQHQFSISSNSLKRKRVDDDEHSHLGYPFNLDFIYPPHKRRRTPPMQNEENLANVADSNVASMSQSLNGSEIQDIATEALLSDIPRTMATTPQPTSQSRQEIAPPATSSKLFSFDSGLTRTPSPRPPSSSSGFAAFAGNSSPFGSPRPRSATVGELHKPAWCKLESSRTKNSSQEHILGTAAVGARTASEPVDLPKIPAIAPAPVSSESPCTYISGEEDENVDAELKNVKLFIRRGMRPFSEGLVGHIKLLSHKKTADKRVVFRREPLWKVSMNLRLQPTLRCSYDAEEQVVRLVHTEPVHVEDGNSDDSTREVVVYAMRPGRSWSKGDFRNFAESLLAWQTSSKPVQ